MHSTTFKKPLSSVLPSRRAFPLVALAVSLLTFASARVEAEVDYLYGLHRTPSGPGWDAPSNWSLAQFAVDNPGGWTPTITASTVLSNLNSYISGYGSAGRYYEYVNGLAIDTANNRVYFNYTYNTTNTAGDSGTYYFNLYKAEYISGAWSVSAVGGTHGSFWVGASGSPNSNSAVSGAYPAAGFHDNFYYARGQSSDDAFRLTLNSNGTAATGIQNFPNFDGSALNRDYTGGDLVVSSLSGSATLYTATVALDTDTTTFLRRNVAQMVAGSWSATSININSQIPYATHGAVQIAGLGDSSRLYGLASNSGDLFVFNNPDGATASGLIIRNIGSVDAFIGLGGSISDLSEGLSTPIVPVPEPSSALLVAVCGILAILRRRPRGTSQLPKPH